MCPVWILTPGQMSNLTRGIATNAINNSNRPQQTPIAPTINNNVTVTVNEYDRSAGDRIADEVASKLQKAINTSLATQIA